MNKRPLGVLGISVATFLLASTVAAKNPQNQQLEAYATETEGAIFTEATPSLDDFYVDSDGRFCGTVQAPSELDSCDVVADDYYDWCLENTDADEAVCNDDADAVYDECDLETANETPLSQFDMCLEQEATGDELLPGQGVGPKVPPPPFLTPNAVPGMVHANDNAAPLFQATPRDRVVALKGAFGQLQDLRGQMTSIMNNKNLSPEQKQMKMMEMQQKMNSVNQMIQMLSNIMKSQHQTAMAIIRNIQ